MSRIRDLILATLCALAVIAVLEGGMRLTHERFQGSFYQTEPVRGYALRPNAEGWNVSEGNAYVRVNSGGLRDRERTLERPPGALRLAVIGASEATSLEVPLEETFETVMEGILARKAGAQGKRVEALNFGVPGYSLSQDYLTLEHHVWNYDPQVVVLVWNQFSLLKNTEATFPEGSEPTPIYVLRNGQLIPPAQPPGAVLSPGRIALKGRLADWTNSSYLLSMLHQAEVSLQDQITALGQSLRGDAAAPADALGRPKDYVQWWPYLPDLPAVQEDWKVSEALLREMKQDCQRHGADFVVVIADEQMQSHPDIAARKAFMQLKDLPSLDAADNRLEQFCRQNGIGVLALAPPMGAYAVAHNVMLHGGGDNAGHWNQLGHQVAARLISDFLLTQSPAVQNWAASAKR